MKNWHILLKYLKIRPIGFKSDGKKPWYWRYFQQIGNSDYQNYWQMALHKPSLTSTGGQIGKHTVISMGECKKEVTPVH